MLPQTNENTLPTKRTIFINPNFTAMTQSKNEQTSVTAVATHVNPLFLRPRQQVAQMPPSQPQQRIHMNPQFIHMNPAFYQKKLMEHQELLQIQQQKQQQQQLQERLANTAEAQILTLRKQQNESIPMSNKPVVAISSTSKNVLNANTAATAPLLHLSRRKLIRRTATTTTTTNARTDAVAIREVHPILGTKANTRLNTPSGLFRYKLDRRKPPTTTSQQLIVKPQPALQSQYLLKKQRKLIRRLPPVLKPKTTNAPTVSQNKKLKMVSINNILYKSTHNKLQRSDASNKAITLRTKLLATIASHKKALSIQKTRTYLNNVKQRSVQQLSKHYKKTNEPCVVYQRLGKCAAHERGRCNKKHDKQQVIVCPKLLRGECFNSNCLLSHNISLAKMPVCKFYLQGQCVRNNCPYLHKKLNEKAEVCTDFLRGFCQLAEKCDKRHEFQCPELALKKKCTLQNCMYCKQITRWKETKCAETIVKKTAQTKQVAKIPETQRASDTIEEPTTVEEAPIVMRYFDGNDKEAVPAADLSTQSDSNDDTNEVDRNNATVGAVSRQNRPKIGILPAFIPLS